ncbi:MAG: hypothetical protein ACRDTQ_12705 [Micromonosporaceae bacterium]
MRRVEGEQIEFRLATGEFVRINLVIFLGFAAFYSLMLIAGGWLSDWLFGYRRAVDFWDLGLQPGLMLLIGLPLVLIMAAAMAKKRQSTVLTSYGVEHPPLGVGAKRGFVPWHAVVGVDVIQAGFVRLIGLRLRDNRTVRIAPPQAFRSRDPRLTSALAAFREHARRHGAGVDAPVKPFRVVFTNLALVIFCLVAVAGLARLVVAPVIPPWAPQAGPLPDACEAADRAGLDELWAPAKREPSQPNAEYVYQGALRQCDVSAKSPSGSAPDLSSVAVEIERHDGGLLSSGAKEAYQDVAQQQEYGRTLGEVDIGDIGYRLSPYGSQIAVVTAYGNVVVTVEVEVFNGYAGEGPAGRVAEKLAAGVLEQIRFD